MPAADAVADVRARSAARLAGPVLVTGATGFVGANLVRRLLALGADVHAAARPSTSTWRIDDACGRVHLHAAALGDADALQRAFQAARPRVVFHLATPRSRDEDDVAGLLAPTVLGAAHLVRLCRTHQVEQVVVTGSSLEYAPSGVPIREDWALEPTTIHGVAKAAASLLWRQAARATGLPACVLRLFHVYGPWESRHRLVPAAFRAALEGTPLPLSVGLARDWIHVDDVVDALVCAAGLDRPGAVINLGTGREHSNEAVVACIARTLGRPLLTAPGAFPLRPTDPAHRRADITEARRLLGWSPRLSLEDGMKRTAEWRDRHPAAWHSGADLPPVVH